MTTAPDTVVFPQTLGITFPVFYGVTTSFGVTTVLQTASTTPVPTVQGGLTTREYFAIRILQGIVSGPSYQPANYFGDLATQACSLADALIAKLNSTHG